ncbi:unnamed protein product, partial [Tetraodon nigroviridis]
RRPLQLTSCFPHHRADRPVVRSYTPRRFLSTHTHTHTHTHTRTRAGAGQVVPLKPASPHQSTWLQSSSSISASGDCPSPSSWTPGTKLPSMRSLTEPWSRGCTSTPATTCRKPGGNTEQEPSA